MKTNIIAFFLTTLALQAQVAIRLEATHPTTINDHALQNETKSNREFWENTTGPKATGPYQVINVTFFPYEVIRQTSGDVFLLRPVPRKSIEVFAGASGRRWFIPMRAITNISVNNTETAYRLDWSGHTLVFVSRGSAALSRELEREGVAGIYVPSEDGTKRMVTRVEYFFDANDPAIEALLTAADTNAG